MSDHLKMPVHEQWTCGHIATAMCSECHQELIRKANELQADNDRLRADARAYANVMLSEENDRLIEENKRLRAEIELVSK